MGNEKLDDLSAPLRGLDRDHPDAIKRCYCIFEGGGARGILHVGALKALQEVQVDNGIELRGFAGTSAGAIIAALAAVGYRADELIELNKKHLNKNRRRTVLDDIMLHPPFLSAPFRTLSKKKQIVSTAPRLIGSGWHWLRLFRFVGARWWIIPFLFVAIVGSVAVFPLISGFESQNFVNRWWAVFAHFSLISSLFVVVGTLVMVVSQGLVSLDRVRDGLDEAFRRKIPTNDASPLTFADLEAFWRERLVSKDPDMHSVGICEIPSLKIVATDISNGLPEVFSFRTTPMRPIAEAVAASIAIPVFFGPRRLEFNRGWRWSYRWYVDGGLVSNLPGWVFDEERRLDLEAATVLATIRSRTARRTLSQIGFSPLFAAVQTAVVAPSALQNRLIDRIFVAPLDAKKVGLLDFDVKFDRIRELVIGAYTSTKYNFGLPMVVDQKIANKFCYRVEDLLRKIIPEQGAAGKLRVSIFFPEGLDHSGMPLTLYNRFNLNFHGFPDRFVRLPVNNSHTGRAWSTGSVVVGGEGAPKPPDEGTTTAPKTLTGVHHALRAYIHHEMKWCLCIPIDLVRLQSGHCRGEVSDGPPEFGRRRFVVSIDGQTEFGGDNEKKLRLLKLVAASVVSIFQGHPDSDMPSTATSAKLIADESSDYANFFGADYLWGMT